VAGGLVLCQVTMTDAVVRTERSLAGEMYSGKLTINASVGVPSALHMRRMDSGLTWREASISSWMVSRPISVGM